MRKLTKITHREMSKKFGFNPKHHKPAKRIRAKYDNPNGDEVYRRSDGAIVRRVPTLSVDWEGKLI